MKNRILVLSIAVIGAIAAASYFRPAEAHIRITTDITWSGEIRGIFEKHCMPCHNPNGAAPDYVDLTFYGTDTQPGARAWAAAIEDEIMMDRMPPWNPDPRFGEFQNSRRLTAEEKIMIVNWVEGGGPQGPLRNLAMPDQFQRIDWTLGRPDVVVSMPKGHIVPAEKQYDRAVVRVPIEIEKDTYITGYEFLVENPRNVARVTAFIHDPEGFEPKPIELEMQVPYDPLAIEEGPEPTRMRPMPAGPHYLGEWVKGNTPVFYPDAAGHVLRAGSTVEMIVEYVRPDFADWSQEIRDNTRLGLFLASLPDEVDLLVESKQMAAEPFVIGAGKKDEKTIEYTFDENVHLIGIAPRLGPVATKFKLAIEYPDGFEKTLVWVPKYQQKWSATYRFGSPVVAPVGSTLVLTATYDNTAANLGNPNDPPVNIASGPGYLDEKLSAYFDYLLDDHLKLDPVIVAKETPQSGGGMLGGTAPDLADPKNGPPLTVQQVSDDVTASLELPGEPERFRIAKNGYHQIQGVMRRPGEFSLYIFDDQLNPIDPRNFSGELVFDGGARTVPLTYPGNGEDGLSAWIDPSLPQEFEARVDLAGAIESVPFKFERLTPADSAAAAGSSQPSFVNPPHGGWLDSLEDAGVQVEATLHEPRDLRLYFYDAEMNPIDPRNFRGSLAVAANGAAQSPVDLGHPSARAEYLGAAVPDKLPLEVVATLWIGDKKGEVSFEFDELTEEPWLDAAVERKPLFVGPHGSPQIYRAANGFHLVEAALPRPGELRVYVYDGFKNPVAPALFTGDVQIGDKTFPLGQFDAKDDFRSVFAAPELPLTAKATLWIAGEKQEFAFTFDEITVDPVLAANNAIAHMDHTPLHGGQFHMADNMFHHVEGTLPRPGEFRAYFYDDFKRPIDPRNFSGNVFIEHLNEATGAVTEDEFKLELMRPGDDFLTAMLPGTLPITCYARIDLGGEPKRFDFHFEELTVDMGGPMQMASAAPMAGMPAVPGMHMHYRPPFTMPTTVEGILALMAEREAELSRRIASNDIVTLYQPALDIKDLVAALAAGNWGLDVRASGKLKMLVGSVNLAVDKMDRAGDTGDVPRAQSILNELSGSLAEARKLFPAKP